MNTMLATAQESIRRAARDLGYDEATIEAFLKPEHEHSFVIEVGGKQYQAYRVQHNSKLGPYKGGVRYHPGVSLDEVRALATLMSLKTAAVGLPLGGGKGGVIVDPKQITASDLETISREYGRQLAPYIGSDKDIPGPDVNTNAETMDWMLAGYEAAVGKKDPGAFTGKSIKAGGSEGRHPATGRGAVVVLREYLAANNMLDKPLTLALQGFGNAGYYFALELSKVCPNVKLVAIANSKHTWLKHDGIDVTRMAKQTESPEPEDLSDLAAAEVLPNTAIIGARADILALAALEDAVNEQNVSEVKASLIIELANGPITDKAEAVLLAKKVAIIPDIIANAGGVIVSCLEWQQNLKHEHWTAEKVYESMRTALVHAAQEMLTRAKERGSSYKQAAFENALHRILG